MNEAADVGRVDILGCRLDRVDLPMALARLEELIAGGRSHQALVVPVNSVMTQRKDRMFRAICNSASLLLPDGVPLLWAARFLGRPIPGRVAGSDLLWEFSRVAAHRGYSFFFLGSKDHVLQKLTAELVRGNPGLKVAGMYAPPFVEKFSPELNAQIVERINGVRPDVLWVGFGAPKQERWIHQNLPRLEVKVAIGVGAAFELASGTVRRAPGWMQKAGLEWLFRFIVEPRRLFKRYFVDAAPFFPLVLAQKLAGHSKNQP
jgi:N-acetylglucosaminyldiphosphoundecaprenol N-acetyl-beta-D-mannosaminyltransferase